MKGRRPIPALAPLGWAYLRAAALRNALFDRGWLPSASVEAPVVCLGNISAGGVGKTPAVAWLSRELEDAGTRVGIVSRGYGGERAEDPLVVAPPGSRPASPSEAGDEAVMLARAGVASFVVVARRRAEGARVAISMGAELILLDDGFQHRYLRRDLDIVLADHDDPLACGRGLPAGLLRESPRGLARAGLVLLTRCPGALAALERPLLDAEMPPGLRRALDALPAGERPAVLASRHAPRAWRDAEGAGRPVASLAGRRVLAVAGIGQPMSFARSLEACGCELAGMAAFPDHHAFDEKEAARLWARARELGVDLLITTEKDAVRWPAGAPRPALLEIELSIGASGILLERVREAARRRSAGHA